ALPSIEIVEIEWSRVAKALPQASAENVGVISSDGSHWLVSQCVDEDGNGTPDKLLVRRDDTAKQSLSYRVFAGVDRARIPAPTERTTLQLAPSHMNDIA